MRKAVSVAILFVMALVVSCIALGGQKEKTVPIGKLIPVSNMLVCASQIMAVALAKTRNEEGDEAFKVLITRALREGVCGVAEGNIIYQKAVYSGGVWKVFELKDTANQSYWEITDWNFESI